MKVTGDVMKPIKLLIYGGQGGLEEFIEKEEDIKAIGVTGSEMDLLDFNHTSSVMPDVILIDARSSGKYGQEVMPILKVKHPSTPFLIFTAYSEDYYRSDMPWCSWLCVTGWRNETSAVGNPSMCQRSDSLSRLI
ncbi:response regulator transcription factor [Streptomyces sp. ISL-14]|nr:response regulator transcription factor [Streptomyces sp. ISL-14]